MEAGNIHGHLLLGGVPPYVSLIKQKAPFFVAVMDISVLPEPAS
jgi:hypothetical protein